MKKSVRVKLFPIFFVIFTDNFGYSLLYAILGPLLLLPEYGMGLSHLSLGIKHALFAITFGVFHLTQLIGSPLMGDFADHFGRKKALYITVLASVFRFILSAVALWIHSLTFLIIIRFIGGFFGGNLGVCYAVIADLSHNEKARAKNIAFASMLSGLSWIFSLAIGGYFAEPAIMGSSGPFVAFLITALLAILNFAAIFLWFEETFVKGIDRRFDLLAGVKNILQVFTLKEIRIYYLAYLLWIVGWGMTIQWFSPYAIEIYQASVALITTWLIIRGVAWIISSLFINNLLLKRWNSLAIANLGVFCSAATLFVIFLIPWFTPFAIMYIIATLFAAFSKSNILNLISLSASQKIQGKVMGLTHSMSDFGWIITFLLTSLIFSNTLSPLFLVGGIILLFVFLLLGYSLLHTRKT